MREKLYNPITSTGYYFSQTLNLTPGENIDINLLTKKQAQDILKSEVVNHIEMNDLKLIKQIANAPELTVPFPLRSGQILVSENIDNEMKLVWKDYNYLPKESQVFPIPKLSKELFSKYANCTYVERQVEWELGEPGEFGELEEFGVLGEPGGRSYAEIVKTGPDNLFYIATSDLIEGTLTLVFDGTPLIIAGSTTDSLEKHLDYTSGGYLEVRTNQLVKNGSKNYNNILYDFSINPEDLLYITATQYGYKVQNQQGQSFSTLSNDTDYLLIGSTSGQSIKIIDCGLPVNLNQNQQT